MRLLKEIRNLLGSYHVKSGIYHYYRNEFKQAVDFFRKALKEDPQLSDSERQTALYYLTQTFVNSAARHERNGDLDDAVLDYERAIEVSPDYPDIRFRLGKALETHARLEDAIEQYHRAIDLNPRYLQARVALAFCLLASDRRDEAADAFEEAVEIRIQKIREPFDRGLERLRQGEIPRASEDFFEALRSTPEQVDRHYRAALAFLKAEDYENALHELNRAVELNPNFADLHNFQGVALCELDRVTDGIVSFRRAIELNSGYLVPRLNLAFALIRTGEYKEAEAELEAVLEHDPTQHAASTRLEELREGRHPDNRRAAPPRGSATI
jgi:tetratricopeptide (TPR) repeat protein